MKRFLFISIGAIFSLFLGAVAFIMTDGLVKNTARAEMVVATPVTVQDSRLVEHLQKLGATKLSGVSLKTTDHFDIEGKWGEYQDHTITVLMPQSEQNINKSLAHEYLHHIYFDIMDESERLYVDSAVTILYGKDGAMQQRMDWYSDKGRLSATELFSTYCTEVSDAGLSDTIRDECNKYISRGQLVMQR